MPIIITIITQSILITAGVAALGAIALMLACSGLDGVPEGEMK